MGTPGRLMISTEALAATCWTKTFLLTVTRVSPIVPFAARAARSDVDGLFILAETGWVERAHGVSARIDPLVSLVSDIGFVGGLPLP
jgi:hypothetical protein